jgi:uroporphyrinogen-III synthase
VRYLGQPDKDQMALNLQQASALCPHENIAKLASEIGFGEVRLCGSGDAALLKASLQWVENLVKDPAKTTR